jgi:hypothetical protein
MCFIGHGTFGIITKQIWCNYFGVFGIDEALSYQLMPVVGVIDIVLGVTLLVYPTRAVAWWLVFWGLFTALLRPLSGEPFAEFLERAGNYGAPLILLMLAGTLSEGGLGKVEVAPVNEQRWIIITRALRIIGFILLAGHGWLNLIEKASLVKQYAALGFQHPEQMAFSVGCFELIGALFILIKPLRSLVLILFIWKMASELVYPAYGAFEWIERGGSYVVLLALWLMLKHQRSTQDNTNAVNAGEMNLSGIS